MAEREAGAEERPAKLRKLSHGALDREAILESKEPSFEKFEPQPSTSSCKQENDDQQSAPVSPLCHAATEDAVTKEINAGVTNPDNFSAGALDTPGTKSANADDTVILDQPAAVLDESDAEDFEESNERASSGQSLSKNQLKKLMKKQKWEEGRDSRKLKRKQKTLDKRARKRVARQGAEEIASNNGNHTNGASPKSYRGRHTLLPITLVLDCGYDDLMNEKERMSLGAQLTRSYSDNHKAQYQAHLIVSSWGGELKQRFDTVLAKHHENWKGVDFMEGDFVKAAEKAKSRMHSKNGGKLAGTFAPAHAAVNSILQTPSLPPADAEPHPSRTNTADGKEEPDLSQPGKQSSKDAPQAADSHAGIDTLEEDEVIYLSSDSPNTLDRLKPYGTYIIGGLVDHNRHKGICYKTACDRGIKTAKLPIGEYMEMQSRFVLATTHVVEIMLRWLECGNWGEAFMTVMPKRKGGKLKEAVGSATDDASYTPEATQDMEDSDARYSLEDGSTSP